MAEVNYYLIDYVTASDGSSHETGYSATIYTGLRMVLGIPEAAGLVRLWDLIAFAIMLVAPNALLWILYVAEPKQRAGGMARGSLYAFSCVQPCHIAQMSSSTLPTTI